MLKVGPAAILVFLFSGSSNHASYDEVMGWMSGRESRQLAKSPTGVLSRYTERHVVAALNREKQGGAVSSPRYAIHRISNYYCEYCTRRMSGGADKDVHLLDARLCKALRGCFLVLPHGRLVVKRSTELST